MSTCATQKLTLANIGFVPVLVIGAVEARLAFVAVDALSVVPAAPADPSSFVPPMDVQGQAFGVHFRIILALVRVLETVADWKRGGFFQFSIQVEANNKNSK